MPYTNFINAEWSNGQIDSIKAKAQNRYCEELNTNTITSSVFDAIQRNCNFKEELKTLITNLKQIEFYLNNFNKSNVKKIVKIKETITNLRTSIQEIICNTTANIDWMLINNFATQAYNDFIDLSKEISNKDTSEASKIRSISLNLLPIINW